MKIMKGILQIVLLSVIFEIGNAISDFLHLPVPVSIVGVLILFILLTCKVIKVEWVELGAKWLLAELLLFFIPSAVGIVNFKQIIGPLGIKIMAIIGLSTLFVMVSTGLAADYLSKNRKEKKCDTAI